MVRRDGEPGNRVRVGHDGVGEPGHRAVDRPRERTEPFVGLDVPAPGHDDGRPGQAAGHRGKDVVRVEPGIDDVVAASPDRPQVAQHPLHAATVADDPRFAGPPAHPEVQDAGAGGPGPIVVLARASEGQEVDPEALPREALREGNLLPLRTPGHEAGDHVGDPQGPHRADPDAARRRTSRPRTAFMMILGSARPSRAARMT